MKIVSGFEVTTNITMDQLFQDNPRVRSTYTDRKNRSLTDSLGSYQNRACKEVQILRRNARLPSTDIVWHLLKELTVTEITALRKKVFRYLKDHKFEGFANIELTRNKSGQPNNRVHFHILTDDSRSEQEIRELFNKACERYGLVRNTDFWISYKELWDGDQYFEYFTKRNRNGVILFQKGLKLQKLYRIGKWFTNGKCALWKEIKAIMREKYGNNSNLVKADLENIGCESVFYVDWIG